MKIERKIDVAIEPSVGEIANAIWAMDSDEQAFLLELLANRFGKVKSDGLMQMSYIAESLGKRNLNVEKACDFISDLAEYINRKTCEVE